VHDPDRTHDTPGSSRATSPKPECRESGQEFWAVSGTIRAMKSIAIKVLVNGIALWLAALVISGINFGEDSSLGQKLLTILIVAVIFGLLNAVLKPIVKFFSLPLIILTLGLFTFIINALMLQLTSWFADKLSLAFHVDEFFWDAVLGAIVITFVSMVLHLILPDGDDD
jgi:putative membrane protein